MENTANRPTEDSSDGNEMIDKRRSSMDFGNLESEVDALKDGHYPEWFLIEVLSRLPVKCVFRSKCVSKQWLSLISDSSFVRFYISRALSVSQPQPWTILSSVVHSEDPETSDFPEKNLLKDMYADDLRNQGFYAIPLPHSEHPNELNYRIMAVNDGLVLYGLRDNIENLSYYIAEYYICNPVTKQWFALPPPKHSVQRSSTGFVTQVDDGILANYKVVRLDCPSESSDTLKFEVFSSETGAWTDFAVSCGHAIKVCRRKMPISFKGNLHWVNCQLGILAYDPYNNPDNCRMIPLPADIDRECNSPSRNGMTSLCAVHEGVLKYFEVSTATSHQPGFSGFKIWMLNDYGAGKWILQHSVKHADIQFDNTLSHIDGACPFSVCFHPFEANVVYLGWGNAIFSYNIQTRKMESHGNAIETAGISWRWVPRWWSVFLLVLPSWPTLFPLHHLGANAD